MTKEQTINLLKRSDEMVKQSLVFLFQQQTAEEQGVKATCEQNGRGFNGFDAPFLSSLAEQVIKHGTLSEKQLTYARRDLVKYAGQLSAMSEDEPSMYTAQTIKKVVQEVAASAPKATKPVLTLYAKPANKVSGNPVSLYAEFKYDSNVVAKIKSLGQRYYNPTTYQWEIPITSYKTIREMFPDMEIVLHSEKPLDELLPKEKPANRKMADNFSFKTSPYPHQIEGLEYGLKHDSWLLGDEQGLGKTKQAIDIAVNRKLHGEIEHCIIVCGVNGLKYNWKREVELHSDESAYVIGSHVNKKGNLVDGSLNERIESLQIPRKEFFLIINIESLRSEELLKILLKMADRSMLVVDEIHRCANPTSQQAKGLLKFRAKYALAMTGTPVMNKPVDLFSILKWLGEESGSFFQFKNRYCVFGGYGGYEVVGYKNMAELRARIERVMLRRLKKEVLNLPEKIRQFEYVEMGGKQELLYREVQALIKANLSEIELDPNPLAQLIRLRQVTGAPEILSDKITESAKLDRMEEIVEELIQNEQKVVIFSQWSEMVEAAKKRLQEKYSVAVITGDVKVDERQTIVNEFQTNRKPFILLGTAGAMGTGLTLTGASTAIFLDLPWTEAALAQAEDRLHRIGTTGTVNIICLTCRGTIDEKIIKIVEEKRDISEALIDGKMTRMDRKQMLEYLVG